MFRRLLCSTAVLVAATAVVAQDSALAGRVEGDTYISPTGEFKVQMPVLPELGGSITDTENVVTFSDNYNTHISIACFELDAAQKWELETRTLRDYLLYFFNNFVLADFKSRFPQSSIESARFLPTLMSGTMITFALLPGGSYFEKKNQIGDAPQTPVVAKRGTLLFMRHRHIYVISAELAERATQRSTYNRTVDQENQLLIERLTTLLNRFTFLEPKARLPAP
ncbi:MAG TPA: hypothetical protein VGM64_19370 [Lacunisphaera sp.]|jgi:hypothetical protein